MPGARSTTIEASAGSKRETIEFNLFSFMMSQGNDLDSHASNIQEEALEQIKELKDKLDSVTLERQMLQTQVFLMTDESTQIN